VGGREGKVRCLEIEGGKEGEREGGRGGSDELSASREDGALARRGFLGGREGGREEGRGR